MDPQLNKIEETFLAPVGSALLQRDTQVIERDGWYQLITPSSSTTIGNEVAWSRLAAGEAESAVDATIAQYAAHGRPFKWCVGPLTEPANFASTLERRGLSSYPVRGMAIDPAAWRHPVRAGISVERVTAATLRVYLDCWLRGWELPLDDSEWYANHVRWMAEGRSPFYLARVDGEPAGTAAFIVKPRCAYLIGGNVLPAFRGRGVYSALIDARLADVVARGLSLAVTQAREATSAPILEALGFESLYRSFVYRWLP